MKVINIKKRSGGVRKIVVPSRRMRKQLREYLEELNNAQLVYCDQDIVHGFIPGKNAVTCAMAHIGYQYTLNLDLSNFFDTVTKTMLQELNLKGVVLQEDMFYDNVTAQGLPTSPALANLAASKMDKQLKTICDNYGIRYTRYADDLSFSHNDKDTLLYFRDNLVVSVIENAGFTVNKKKTRFQSAGPDGTWTREVVGVGVNHESTVPLRYSKRRLRAAKHKTKYDHSPYIHRKAEGLQEWNSLKVPNNPADVEGAEAYFILKELGVDMK